MAALLGFFSEPLSTQAEITATNKQPVRLAELVHKTLWVHFNQPPARYQSWAKQFSVPKSYQRQAGIFVTISKQGKTRACWGHLNPTQPDLIKETVFTTLDALGKEYRYSPIKKSELPELKAQVAIVEGIVPIRSYRELNPYRDGLLLRSGSRSAVILPREATDAYYQWVMARTKAGIRQQDAQQLYRLKIQLEEK